MVTKEFDEWFDNLTDEQKEDIKKLVIARLKQIPDNFRLCLG